MKMNRLNEWSTRNNTGYWAVMVDGLYGLYATRDAAMEVYSLIGGERGSNGLDNTPFGSCRLLPPGYRPQWRPKYEAEMRLTERDITEINPIDIAKYIRSRWAAWRGM